MLASMVGEPTDAATAAPPPPQATATPPPKCMLVIVRHGYSEYNAENRFTGWADVELSAQGREEARFAGSLLREAGVRRLEKVYASYLKRAIKTSWLMLDELELQWVPIEYTWRLNERHYGLLQGRPKRLCSEDYGVKQVQKWRRGVHYPPPPWEDLQRAATIDRRYAGVPVPESESLADCAARLRPFLHETLWPQMRASVAAADKEVRGRADRRRVTRGGEPKERPFEPRKLTRPPKTTRSGRRGPAVGGGGGGSSSERVTMTGAAVESAAATPSASYHSDGDSGAGGPAGVPSFVIASSENLIRALVAELEGLDESEIPLLDIPYATPLVYQFDAELRPLPSPLSMAPLRHGYYLGDAERIRDVQRDIRDSLVTETSDVATNAPSEGPRSTGAAEAAEASETTTLASTGSDTCFLVDDADGSIRWVCDEPPADEPACDEPPAE